MSFQPQLMVPHAEGGETLDQITLRPYQVDGVQGLYDYWGNQLGEHPLCVIPTGGGKSIMMSKFMQDVVEADPDARIISVTHVKELIGQNYAELKGLWPWASAGIFSAGLKRKEHWHQITFAGIQSCWKHAAKFGSTDILIVDECHLIPRNADTMYRKFIDALIEINPAMKIVGFTATEYRLDSGLLHVGDERIFDGIAYKAEVSELMNDGYLSPLSSKKTATVVDATNIKKRGGEYVDSALQEDAALNDYEKTKKALDEVERFGQSRRSWLLFCTGVAHAEFAAEELNRRGYPAGCVTGNSEDRDQVIEDFKSGKLRALTNANVLTTGFNAKAVDLIGLLRPTESTGLYIQMLGRGTRLSPGKENCLILDFARNIARHGPFDDPIVKDNSRKSNEKGEPPVKACPECFEFVAVATQKCPECGHEFTPEDRPEKIDGTAADLPVMKNTRPTWIKVDDWEATRHFGKFGKKDTVKVSYRAGLEFFDEWLCVEHEGFARNKFVNWWNDHDPEIDAPKEIDAFCSVFEDALIMPSHILVQPDGNFFRVTSRKFERPAYSDNPDLQAQDANHDPMLDEIPF